MPAVQSIHWMILAVLAGLVFVRALIYYGTRNLDWGAVFISKHKHQSF